MKTSSIADTLWGNKLKLRYLFIASIVLLFAFLGGREIWTQEHRWADIVSGMFYRHDFLHPYLGEARYYDKPLLSYWLIVFFADITGSLNMWALRLPSALAGLLAVWSIYRLGTKLKDKQLGLLSGWMLLTTFYFIFWARTSSADMLNVAGSLFAIAWYVDKRDQQSFFNYAFFFIILALTSLCKGLVGAIVPVIAVLIDIVIQQSWRRHLRWSLLWALFPALIIYLLPFLASSYYGGEAYGQSGLYLVYRENILRFFQPFDHKGPIYTYFIFLPLYLLPWTFFFVPALYALKGRWKCLSKDEKWLSWTLLCLFLFFTLSGSRRSYYVLPLVPFAILFTADWLLMAAPRFTNTLRCAVWTILLSYILLFITLDLVPAWYYSSCGVQRFASALKEEAGKEKPWDTWHVVMLDAESKLIFYLGLPPSTKIDGLHKEGVPANREQQTTASLLKAWPILNHKPRHTIFITRKRYVQSLKEFFVGYRLVEMPTKCSFPFMKNHEMNMPVAFIPEEN